MFILHNKRFDMTSWFGFPEYIFCSERDIHLFIFFTYLVRRYSSFDDVVSKFCHTEVRKKSFKRELHTTVSSITQ